MKISKNFIQQNSFLFPSCEISKHDDGAMFMVLEERQQKKNNIRPLYDTVVEKH